MNNVIETIDYFERGNIGTVLSASKVFLLFSIVTIREIVGDSLHSSFNSKFN